MINRHISGYVAGTAKIASIEIIRNGDILHTFHPDGNNFEYEYDDLSPFAQVTLKDPQNGAPFAFYYLRVTQENGAMAWSSPIWIDLN